MRDHVGTRRGFDAFGTSGIRIKADPVDVRGVDPWLATTAGKTRDQRTGNTLRRANRLRLLKTLRRPPISRHPPGAKCDHRSTRSRSLQLSGWPCLVSTDPSQGSSPTSAPSLRRQPNAFAGRSGRALRSRSRPGPRSVARGHWQRAEPCRSAPRRAVTRRDARSYPRTSP